MQEKRLLIAACSIIEKYVGMPSGGELRKWYDNYRAEEAAKESLARRLAKYKQDKIIGRI